MTIFTAARLSLTLTATSLMLMSCSYMPGRAPDLPLYTPAVTPVSTTPVTPVAPQSTHAKVTMLLPLSGTQQKLGEAMQNAATLAMSDLGYEGFELTFEDTGSTASGASTAARNAITSGTNLILGPIFADEVRAAKTQLAGTNLSMIAFSTDMSVASPNTYVMGILPQNQAQQIATFAADRGAKSVLVIAPNDSYGKLVTTNFTNTLSARGVSVMGTVWTDGNTATLPAKISALTSGAQKPDAVFIPLAAEHAAQIIPMIRAASPTSIILGMGLWDDVNVATNPALIGAYYAAPAPSGRTRFEQLYTRQFGAQPPRLASLGYDSVALSVTIGHALGAAGYTSQTLTDLKGFSGVDGLFRFGINGMIDRRLPIIQLQPGAKMIASPAPARF